MLKFHPYTFGYNGDNLKHYDQVLTAKEDVGSFQTLDYIFDLDIKNLQRPMVTEALLERGVYIQYNYLEEISR